ncbi:MAG: hypothetical protein WCL00_10235 [Bacteroidota bacterium]
MRKAGYFILVTLLLLQSGGLFLMYKAQQTYVQYEMMLVLSAKKQNFISLSLSMAEYFRSKIGSKELSWHGDLYDIKSLSFHEKHVELLVLKDNRETTILKRAGATANGGEHNHGFPVQLRRILMLTYLFPLAIESNQHVPVLEVRYQLRSDSWRSLFTEITTPPPKIT